MVRYDLPHVEKHLGEVMCNNKKHERTVQENHGISVSTTDIMLPMFLTTAR